MYCRLAIYNVRKSFRDYTIYFLTLMFGVCIFYIFNSIESQQSMMVITESQNLIIKQISKIMGFVSIFISVILGFLIVYANNFLIRRRKKEFGIYQILGMEKGQIAQILIIETFLVAIISLIVGLLLGIALSQGFAVITASLFEVKLKGFIFIFSISSTIKTILYFGIAFICVILWSSVTIGMQKLINLLNAERKNEKFRIPHLWLSLILFIISIICLIIAYYLIIKYSFVEFNLPFLQSILFGIIGTFLFFFSLSGFFLKVIQQNKQIYLKGLNIFILKQLNSKINTTYLSLTMVCLMLFLCIGALSSGIGISKALTNELAYLTPYDANYSLSASKNIYNENNELIDNKLLDINLQEYFNKTSINIEEYAKEFTVAKYYDFNIEIMLESENSYITGWYSPKLIKLSEYNKLLTMQGKRPIILSESEFYINCINQQLNQLYINYFSTNNLDTFETPLQFMGVLDNVIENSNSSMSDKGVIIVNDKLISDNADVSKTSILINYHTSNNERLFKQVCDEVLKAIRDYNDTVDARDSFGFSTAIKTRKMIFETSKTISVTVAYIGVYIGIIFLIISTTVLAITQLSESADNIKRYKLLYNLGVDEKIINKALFIQISIYFLLPLILAIIHSIIGIFVVNTTLNIVVGVDIFNNSILTMIILIVIYGSYFFATYFGSKRIIKS